MIQIKLIAQQLLPSKEKQKAGLGVLLITLTSITPLCGFLFQCGCDWPWFGLARHCNYYQLYTTHACPWCASIFTGIFATGLSIMLGIVVALSDCVFLSIQNAAYAVSRRIAYALLLFVIIAAVTAAIAAKWQDYPFGIGRYL